MVVTVLASVSLSILATEIRILEKVEENFMEWGSVFLILIEDNDLKSKQRVQYCQSWDHYKVESWQEDGRDMNLVGIIAIYREFFCECPPELKLLHKNICPVTS